MGSVEPLFPPPLGDLRAQGAGHTYAWLPADAGAAYQTIDLPIPAVGRFPRLRCQPIKISSASRGRKRLEHSHPHRVAMTAALLDGARLTRRQVEQLLYPHHDDEKDWSGVGLGRRERWENARKAAKKKVQEDLRAGRRLLQARRVLPWALWDDGNVPKAWWLTDRFEEAIGWWREDSARAAARDRVERWARLRAEHRAAGAMPHVGTASSNIFTMVLRPSWLSLAAEYDDLTEVRLETLREQPWTFPA